MFIPKKKAREVIWSGRINAAPPLSLPFLLLGSYKTKACNVGVTDAHRPNYILNK